MQLIAIKSVPPPPALRFSDAEVQAMQRAVIRLFDHWGVTDAQAARMRRINAKAQRRKGAEKELRSA